MRQLLAAAVAYGACVGVSVGSTVGIIQWILDTPGVQPTPVLLPFGMMALAGLVGARIVARDLRRALDA